LTGRDPYSVLDASTPVRASARKSDASDQVADLGVELGVADAFVLDFH
jgi:hypothetical protein